MDPKVKREKRKVRARRVRAKIRAARNDLPRLSVYKSNTRLIAQIIDDKEARTLVYVTSTDKGIEGKDATERAVAAAKLLAQKALEKGIEKVVFDRGASAYMGKIKAFADAAREAGLKF